MSIDCEGAHALQFAWVAALPTRVCGSESEGCRTGHPDRETHPRQGM